MKPHKITILYAWVVEHPDGEDGIPAINAGDGTVLPLVGSDRERIESLRQVGFAALSCAMQGMPVKLCKFSTMEVLETIQPLRQTVSG
jgi:hypothetical protein